LNNFKKKAPACLVGGFKDGLNHQPVVDFIRFFLGGVFSLSLQRVAASYPPGFQQREFLTDLPWDFHFFGTFKSTM
jgi:hypothetical protein